jgi:hypothetical protein
MGAEWKSESVARKALASLQQTGSLGSSGLLDGELGPSPWQAARLTLKNSSMKKNDRMARHLFTTSLQLHAQSDPVNYLCRMRWRSDRRNKMAWAFRKNLPERGIVYCSRLSWHP